MLVRSNDLVMEVTFGARLQAQRERQQVTLSAISEETKIRLHLLEELERDDVSHWPQGIFRRSYIRAYAHAIGLDPEGTVREFLDLYPDPLEEHPPGGAAGHNGASVETTNGRPGTRLHFMIGSAISALPHLLFRPEHKDGAIVPSHADASPNGVRPMPRAEVRLVDVPRSDQNHATPLPNGHQEAAPALNGHSRVDLGGMASLCTQLACVQSPAEVPPLLGEAARILDAIGIIVWMWDPAQGVLWPTLCHGYPQDLLARLLPPVALDAENAIAAAFRAREARIVASTESSTGAVVVPMFTPGGCAGVLALELQNGQERHESVQALTTILAAQLSALLEAPPLATRSAATA